MKKSHTFFCYLLSVVLLSATGCRPRNILTSKQMEDIFVDLHTADALLQEAGYNYGHDEELRAYYLAILEDHGTTQAQFDSSLIWYTANPTIFDKIYPKVIDRLLTQYLDYYALVEYKDTHPRPSVAEMLHLCQQGYDINLWQEKSEKKSQKFAHVEKML